MSFLKKKTKRLGKSGKKPSSGKKEHERTKIKKGRLSITLKKKKDDWKAVTTWIGDGTPALKNGTGTGASLNWPYEIVFDKSNFGYFLDFGNHCIRRVSPDGYVTTVAGIPRQQLGPEDVFLCPRGIAMDPEGNVYVADSSSHLIKKINAGEDGQVTIVAGSVAGFMDGIGNISQFRLPYGLAVDNEGNIFVGDSGNHKIRRIAKNGDVSTFTGTESGFLDGASDYARFKGPQGIVFDINGNLIVADRGNEAIRCVTPDGHVTTIAGNGIRGDKDGPALEAEFRDPYGCAVDNYGNIFVVDYGNNKIKQITNDGYVWTVAGLGMAFKGSDDGSLHHAQFHCPCGLAVDKNGVLIVCDTYNHKIRKIVYTFRKMASDWPFSHRILPLSCQKAILTLFCSLRVYGLPTELQVEITKALITCWPTKKE